MLKAERNEDRSDSVDNKPVASLEFRDSRFPGYHDHFGVLLKKIFRIGRDDRSNVALPGDIENQVSRNHCEVYAVEYDPGIHHIYARDRGSCNGTFVNGTKIDSAPSMPSGYLLQDGDEVQIPPYWSFTLSQPDSPPSHDLTYIQKEECKVFADRYSLTSRCLGQGAEATVYLATETLTKKQLVCKLVNLDKIQGRHATEESRRRRQEVDILRQLHHVQILFPQKIARADQNKPNILPYVDAISSPHTLYTFTELAAGGDLMSFVYRHETISELDIQIILRQVISGLEYLHHKGVVHRDLKPENILLANSPKLAYTRILLSDFGASAVPRRSRMITNVGTTRYQAPEFSTRVQPQGPPVDIWSLGIVVLFLLRPLTDRDLGDLSIMDQQELDVSLEKDFFANTPKVSTISHQFVRQCLQVRAADRLTAAQAVQHEWLRGSPAHVKFFHKLDRKIQASVKTRSELNAMPWEIPSVSAPLITRSSALDAADLSSYFEVVDPAQGTVHQPRESLCSQSPEAPMEEPFVFEKPSFPSRASARIPLKVVTPGQGKSTWKYGERAKRRQFKRKRMSELNISPDIKIHDAMDLPLNNLNRHLPPTPNSKKRRQVLEELRRSKAMFLPR